ncbi:MAG: hypothetical protein KHY46_12505, partial [Clostridiales bacterium]|nr:hypothetical protein [Clostridiales bacterium]
RNLKSQIPTNVMAAGFADGVVNIKNITVTLLGVETEALMLNTKGFIKMESGYDEAINRKRTRLLSA